MSTIIVPSKTKTGQISLSRLLWVGPLAAVTAAMANLMVFVISQNLLHINLLSPAGPGSTELAPLPAAAVVIASAIPALAATLLLAILAKFLARPMRIFLIISIVFLSLSFVAPLGLPVDVTTKIILNLMHLLAGVAIVGVLMNLGRLK